MAEKTGIAYVHHTRNFWTGCTKIGPGCDGCYAEAFQRWIRGKDAKTGEAKNWGPGRARVPHLEGAAKDLRRWNKKAAAIGERRRVFINTQSDTFDNEVQQEWRDFAFAVMAECTSLDFLLVTKRIGNVPKMVPDEWLSQGFPSNVRLIITVVDQAEADRDIPKLLALRCRNGISNEPALGPVDYHFERGWCPHCKIMTSGRIDGHCMDESSPCFAAELSMNDALHWVIIGGESDQAGHETRPFERAWARSAIQQCKAAGVPCFVKQLGSKVAAENYNGATDVYPPRYKHPSAENPAEWSPELRVQEVPA